jgi:hypothetical protein
MEIGNPWRRAQGKLVKEKTLQFCLALFFVLLLLLATPLQRVATAASAETYKQNAQGLEKQFESFLKAYQRGDDKGMDEGFAVFRFPKPKEWFWSNFSPEDAVQLNAEYDAQVIEAESALIQDMNLSDPGSRFHVRCEANGTVQGRPGDGFEPLKPIPVEQFRFEFHSSNHGQKFTFVANFVYADGAYRFAGGGGVPFWAKPGARR